LVLSKVGGSLQLLAVSWQPQRTPLACATHTQDDDQQQQQQQQLSAPHLTQQVVASFEQYGLQHIPPGDCWLRPGPLLVLQTEAEKLVVLMTVGTSASGRQWHLTDVCLTTTDLVELLHQEQQQRQPQRQVLQKQLQHEAQSGKRPPAASDWTLLDCSLVSPDQLQLVVGVCSLPASPCQQAASQVNPCQQQQCPHRMAVLWLQADLANGIQTAAGNEGTSGAAAASCLRLTGSYETQWHSRLLCFAPLPAFTSGTNSSKGGMVQLAAVGNSSGEVHLIGLRHQQQQQGQQPWQQDPAISSSGCMSGSLIAAAQVAGQVYQINYLPQVRQLGVPDGGWSA
jgi:hypothetical protein